MVYSSLSLSIYIYMYFYLHLVGFNGKLVGKYAILAERDGQWPESRLGSK